MTLLQGSLLSRPQTREGELRFVLNCIPTAQQRPRHMRTKTGIDLTYKSEAQAANERTLEANLQPFVPLKPLSGALELKFTAVFPIPKSVNKRERQAMLAGEIGHTVKPDLDNLAKQLKDAMTRMRQEIRRNAMLDCAGQGSCGGKTGAVLSTFAGCF